MVAKAATTSAKDDISEQSARVPSAFLTRRYRKKLGGRGGVAEVANTGQNVS